MSPRVACPGLESAVFSSEQDLDITRVVVGNCHVKAAVAVEIAGGDSLRICKRGGRRQGLERPIAPPQVDENVAVIVPVSQIHVPVAVEVGGHEKCRRGAHGDYRL